MSTRTRTVVITGATDGLGRALTNVLAQQPDMSLIVHGRSAHRLDQLVNALGDCPARIHTVRADFADLDQVNSLAQDITRITPTVTVLVNNAGIGAGEPDATTRQSSADGYELRFAVNHLASFALTVRLLPLLGTTAPARIVNVASIGQAPIDFNDLQIEHGYSGQRAYGQSKLAMVATGFAMARRLDPRRITVNSLHPATYMPTKIVLGSVGHSVDSLETGVRATMRLISGAEHLGTTGQFFDRTRPVRAHRDAHDQRIQQRIWNVSADLTGTDLR